MHIVIDARIRRSSTGRYVDRLIEHLQEVGGENRYTVLLQPDDPWKPTTNNFSTVPCPYAQFSFSIFQQIRFTRQLKQLKPDLVHFTMTQQPLFYFGNIVTTTHDLTMLRFVRAGSTPLPIFWVKRLLYKFLFWWSHKKSMRIIVPTEYVAKDLTRLQPFTKDKITVTYEASEPPLNVKAQKPAKISQPFILYVGSAFPHKNLQNLIKAFEILKTSLGELNLVLAGKKEQYYLELENSVAGSPARSSMHFPGFVTDEELKWLYENAAAYVFPSLSEGFGLPGLEAMAHGCPVVSSNATCLPEVYKDAAVYFDPTDPSDMASKIESVLTDKEMASLLVKEGKMVLSQYSWRKMATETVEVYKTVLKI